MFTVRLVGEPLRVDPPSTAVTIILCLFTEPLAADPIRKYANSRPLSSLLAVAMVITDPDRLLVNALKQNDSERN